MQAQRKFDLSVSPPRAEPLPAEPGFSWTPRLAVPRARPTLPSPTHLMWDELAARLQDPSPLGTLLLTEVVEPAKWPMPLRMAMILGLSVASWGAVYLAIAAII